MSRLRTILRIGGLWLVVLVCVGVLVGFVALVLCAGSALKPSPLTREATFCTLTFCEPICHFFGR